MNEIVGQGEKVFVLLPLACWCDLLGGGSGVKGCRFLLCDLGSRHGLGAW
jgi:hypothetical protein